MVSTSRLSRPSLPALPAPSSSTFGGYALVECVGSGGMAEVWLARRPVMPGGLKPCALKIIHGRHARAPRNRRMFLQEARLALKLRHANLVSVFDAGEVEGRLYMALEWIDGVNLRQFVQRVGEEFGRLPVPLVCHVVGELLQGLRYAHGLAVGGHALGVIHRDVAPHNVMVSAAGEVKLTDFGIARVKGEYTTGIHVKGHARYMAPEQLDGEVTPAVDLFAVGGILTELLDGRRFRDEQWRRHEWHRVVSEARVPSLSRIDVPPVLEQLRVGLLQPDPAQRISSADEALQMLLRCPPWPAGASSLRTLYEHCVGSPPRTGLTDPEVAPALPSACADAEGPVAKPVRHHRPSLTRPSSSRPAPPVVSLRASLRRPTVTLERRTTSRSRPLPPGRSWARRPRARSATHRAMRRLGRGLWVTAGILAMVAIGLLTTRTSSGPACIREPLPAHVGRTRLLLRTDGQPQAQLRIDMQVVEVTAHAQCWLSAGVHELEWRGSSHEHWRPYGPYALDSAKEHLLRVGEDGLAISAYDP